MVLRYLDLDRKPPVEVWVVFWGGDTKVYGPVSRRTGKGTSLTSTTGPRGLVTLTPDSERKETEVMDRDPD